MVFELFQKSILLKLFIMKILFMLSMLTCVGAFGQFETDSYFLKNYKAPEFKQRQLNVSFNSDFNSYNKNLSTQQFNENSRLEYRQFSNNQNYQGFLYSSLNSRIDWDKDVADENISMSHRINFYTDNRFYFKPDWYFRAAGQVNIGHSYYKKIGAASNSNFNFDFIPVLAIGKGRLEPIQYARTAIDIERQLKKGNKLNKNYSKEDLTKLADKVAEINNVRYYDYRLRRIKQFEELDKTIREIGGVSEFDIAYFSHLADAYLYAKNFTRFSGFRHEIGIAPIAGFYQLNYHLPQNYAVQHNFNGSVIGGISDDVLQVITEEDIMVVISTGYELSLYPTTRTNVNISANVGSNILDGSYGLKLSGTGDVYLSPQFRLSFRGDMAFGEGIVYSGLESYIYSNTFIGSRLSGKIGLTYNIF